MDILYLLQDNYIPKVFIIMEPSIGESTDNVEIVLGLAVIRHNLILGTISYIS